MKKKLDQVLQFRLDVGIPKGMSDEDLEQLTKEIEKTVDEFTNIDTTPAGTVCLTPSDLMIQEDLSGLYYVNDPTIFE